MDSGVDERVVNAIIAFREGGAKAHPGGGRQHGRVELSDAKRGFQNDPEPQKSLLDY
jgi:PHP family Zn ribbon phosphoesterase